MKFKMTFALLLLLLLVPFQADAALTFVGSYNTPGWANGVAVSGDYAYVADGYLGLRVIDIKNPASPTEVGFYDTPIFSGDVKVSGNYAYVADKSSGLRIINISIPSSPREEGFYDTEDAWSVAMSGRYAYVADNASGLRIIDIYNTANPVEVGSCDTPGLAYDVAVSGDYAYVADASSGLRIIDIKSRTNPIEVGFCDTPSIAYGVAISDKYAYVADGYSGLQVINISDPSSPKVVGSYDTDISWDVAVSGNYAYMADYGSGLRVIDVSDPTSPIQADSYDTPSLSFDVAISGSYIYVADYESGLQILQSDLLDDLKGLWHFDEGSGSIVADSSGNNNAGTIHGANWVKQGNGYCLDFDGIDDYIGIPESNSLDISDFITLEAWIKPDAIQPTEFPTVISKHIGVNPGAQYQMGLGNEGAGYIGTGYKIRFASEPLIIDLSTESVVMDEWNHIAVTYDGSTLTYYLNGRVNRQIPLSGPLTHYNANIAIGAAPHLMWYFAGLIDDVRVYRRALTSDEIKSHYRDSIPNNPPYTPSIPSGPTSGGIGISYSYSTSTTDTEGDQVKYTFDWDDGTTSDTAFVDSGAEAIASHAWNTPGTYQVKVNATDSNGASSGWSNQLAVEMADGTQDILVYFQENGGINHNINILNNIEYPIFLSVTNAGTSDVNNVKIKLFYRNPGNLEKAGDIGSEVDTGPVNKGSAIDITPIYWANPKEGEHIIYASVNGKKEIYLKTVDFNYKIIKDFPQYSQDDYERLSACRPTHNDWACAPVASACILDYWDQHGIPSYILNIRDVSALIGILSEYMSACPGGASVGSAYLGLNKYNLLIGLPYIVSIPVSANWDNIKLDVIRGWPSILYYKTGDSTGHFEPIYGYFEDKISHNQWMLTIDRSSAKLEEAYIDTGSYQSFKLIPNVIKFGTENIIWKCPIDLTLIDPDGNITDDKINNIENSKYYYVDINNDEDPENIITLSDTNNGYYKIFVTPKPDAMFDSNYTLAIWNNNTSIILAEKVLLSNIPPEPYIFQITDQAISQPPIYIEKNASPLYGAPGSRINFTIKIINTGNRSVNKIKVIDYMPNGLTYVSDNRNGSKNGKNISWDNLGSLPTGNSITILLSARIDESVFKNITNRVEVEGISDSESQEEVNNSAYSTIRILEPEIKVEKTLGIAEPIQYEQYCANQKVAGTGAVDVSASMIDKKLALKYSNSMTGDGDIELESENDLSDKASKLKRSLGNNTTSLNLYEDTKLLYSGEMPLSGGRYLESQEFFGGIGARIQEAFSVNDMEKDQQTFFASTDPTSNEVEKDKSDQLRNASSTHLVALETKNTFNGTWGTDATWHKIFYKDVNAHEMFTGTFEAEKLIKFHENPVPEEEHNACRGIDC